MKRVNPSPPKLPLRFFRWYCHPDYQEDIEGDLRERFDRKVVEKGIRAAQWGFIKDVIMLFRPGIIRSLTLGYQSNQYGMLKNFMKSGWRSFVKYKTNSFINVLGLSLGISATILLYLIINYEKSFDQFHDGFENIYRVGEKYPNGETSNMIVTPLLPALSDEYPEIESTTRFLQWSDLFLYKEEAFHFSFHLVDRGFPSMFSFKEIYGNLEEALSAPGNIVLTESISEKLFDTTNPVGEVLKMKDLDKAVVVAAVVQDPPKNSTLQFEALLSWPASPNQLDEDQAGNWYNTFMTGYVRLSDNTSPEALEAKTADFTKKYYLPERKDRLVTFFPLAGEHSRNTANDRTLYILAIIAVAILVISCVNFINLSFSQSLVRTKEIGIRKVIGSRKSQLILQFLVESLVTTVSAVVLGLALVYLLAPYVNRYYDLDISFETLKRFDSILLVSGICLFIGAISSMVTSILFSNVHVIKSLKQKIKWSNSGQWLQKGLIVFQFCISLIFISGTMVIWKQIDFMKSQDLKFSGSNVVAIDAYSSYFKDPDEATKRLQQLRENLSAETAIEHVSLSQNVPGKYWDNYNTFITQDSAEIKSIHLKQITVDHNYFDALGIKILKGRDFSRLISSDKGAVVINASAMKKFGWQDIHNKFLQSKSDTTKLQVIGVVEDYHYRSLKQSIEPLIHHYNAKISNKLLVKLNPLRLSDGLQVLKNAWATLDPYQAFAYSFIDEDFDQLYKTQERLGITTSAFSTIAVVLALLGLFSISTFEVKNRKKEIGIRKAVGATLFQIVLLLSKKFTFLISIAFVIAVPVIYFLSLEFLSDFTYRIKVSPFVFITSGVIIFFLAISIVAWKSGQAAFENPVNALKDD